MIDWKKYILVFVITALIFMTALYVSDALNERKLGQLRVTQDKIATDILSSETRFALLERSSCKHLLADVVLTEELGVLGNRLVFMEKQLGSDNKDVLQLKKYYSLLEIKDFLLTMELDEKCNSKSNTILYFHSNDCDKCKTQGAILTVLRRRHEGIRVYSFDYDLDLTAVNTLKSIYGVEEELPVLVINEKAYTGLKSVEDLEELIPGLKLTENNENIL